MVTYGVHGKTTTTRQRAHATRRLRGINNARDLFLGAFHRLATPRCHLARHPRRAYVVACAYLRIALACRVNRVPPIALAVARMDGMLHAVRVSAARITARNNIRHYLWRHLLCLQAACSSNVTRELAIRSSSANSHYMTRVVAARIALSAAAS